MNKGLKLFLICIGCFLFLPLSFIMALKNGLYWYVIVFWGSLSLIAILGGIVSFFMAIFYWVVEFAFKRENEELED